ncbi:hypothetical protein HK405_009394 [Cladochytrium tenue]|nr:hypothetical protein HK405_009394 [Cladochytrium tenue]
MASTSRVVSSSLAQHVNRTVLLVGRVASFDPHSSYAVIEAADGGQVGVQAIPGSDLQPGAVVEVTGIVNQDLSLQEQISCRFAADYDPTAYVKMLEVTRKFPQLF